MREIAPKVPPIPGWPSRRWDRVAIDHFISAQSGAHISTGDAFGDWEAQQIR